MAIKKDDYIKGAEQYGPNLIIRDVYGWVNYITEQNGHTICDIQADDNWNGARGTLISTEHGRIEKLDERPRPQKKL